MSGKDNKKDNLDGNIQTFLRIRPSKKPSGYFIQDDLDNETLQVNLPENYRSQSQEYINNSKLKHKYHFNGIITMDSTQEQVFKKVGTAAVQNALDGYNSTIFAYGQTGSGKTFTITGGVERYNDRGIIPRSISMIFNEVRSRKDVEMKIYISYLEIYNEQGYDLLNSSQQVTALEDLPKVTMLEDEHGNFHLKNLTVHPVTTEVEALDLLFYGDTNRAVAETPMNLASSRSHCIFTISIEMRDTSNDRVRRSKLHLVDLAGSERVGKTHSSGSVLTEAKYINSSLFYLEMVIVALYEKATKGRQHIPYRNSMMTSVLRDSLGGNCKTIMVATINPEESQTEESLSTCRFAQRVSLIKNKATINEGSDPELVIKRLKNEVLTLREEIAFLKGEAGEGDVLTPKEAEDLREKIRNYCDDPDPLCILNIGELTITKIKDSFAIFKNLVLEARANGSGSNSSLGNGSESQIKEVTEETTQLLQQIKDLKSCLLQRDNEIAILVNMVKKERSNAEKALKGSDRRIYEEEDSKESESDVGFSNTQSSLSTTSSSISNKNDNRSKSNNNGPHILSTAEREALRSEKIIKKHLFGVPPPDDKRIFDDMQACFEYFRSKCDLRDSIEENKNILKEKMKEAQTHGEKANNSRNTINFLKNSIESIRRESALRKISESKESLKDGENEDIEEMTPEENTYRRAIEQEKVIYRDSFEKLRVLKPEIEHVRKILEKSRATLQNQFDSWYNSLHSRDGAVLTQSKSNYQNHNQIQNQNHNQSIQERNEQDFKYQSNEQNNKRNSNYNNSTNNDVLPPLSARRREQQEKELEKNKKLLSSQSSSTLNDSDGDDNSRISTKSNKNSKNNNNRNMNMNDNDNDDDDDDVNEDIMAFYKAKEELLKRRGG